MTDGLTTIVDVLSHPIQVDVVRTERSRGCVCAMTWEPAAISPVGSIVVWTHHARSCRTSDRAVEFAIL